MMALFGDLSARSIRVRSVAQRCQRRAARGAMALLPAVAALVALVIANAGRVSFVSTFGASNTISFVHEDTRRTEVTDDLASIEEHRIARERLDSFAFDLPDWLTLAGIAHRLLFVPLGERVKRVDFETVIEQARLAAFSDVASQQAIYANVVWATVREAVRGQQWALDGLRDNLEEWAQWGDCLARAFRAEGLKRDEVRELIVCTVNGA